MEQIEKEEVLKIKLRFPEFKQKGLTELSSFSIDYLVFKYFINDGNMLFEKNNYFHKNDLILSEDGNYYLLTKELSPVLFEYERVKKHKQEIGENCTLISDYPMNNILIESQKEYAKFLKV